MKAEVILHAFYIINPMWWYSKTKLASAWAHYVLWAHEEF